MKLGVATIVAIALVASACDDGVPSAPPPASSTETTEITVEWEDGPLTVTRPVGCDAPAGTAIDLDAEPAHWLAFGEYLRWFDDAGCPVRVDVISHIHGARHCDLERTEFITIGRPLGASIERGSADSINRYVWNVDGIIAGVTAAETIARADLPAHAFDTGYRQGDRELWLDGHDEAFLYVVSDGQADIWIRDPAAGLCM